MLKYVIFDFDGTLADSKQVLINAYNTLAEKHRFKKIESKDLETMKKLTIKERAKLLRFPMYKLPFIISQLYKLYRQYNYQIKLFSGMKAVLNALQKKGYKIAIISSNSQENIIEILQHHQISSITNLLCSNRIFGKDRLLKKFLRTHGLHPAEVIYVGDEHRDLIACKKAGVKMIWVGWGYDALEAIQSSNPDYKVYKPEEILEIV